MKIQINFTSVFDDHYREFLRFHHHHIQSFHVFNEQILNELISSSIINLTYNRLQLLILDPI